MAVTGTHQNLPEKPPKLWGKFIHIFIKHYLCLRQLQLIRSMYYRS